jgi:hypothetical protein
MQSQSVTLLSHKPVARRHDVVVQEAGDDTLVYDLPRHKAHCLNATAAFVWRHSDGDSSVEKLAQLLATHTASPADTDVILLALRQLESANLLETPLRLDRTISRRDLIKKAGIAVALVPVVASLVAPTPAQAASCLTNGEACTTDSQCCSGNCQGGVICAP